MSGIFDNDLTAAIWKNAVGCGYIALVFVEFIAKVIERLPLIDLSGLAKYVESTTS